MKKAYLLLAAAALLAGSCKKDGTEPGDEKGKSPDRMEIVFKWTGGNGADFIDMFRLAIDPAEMAGNEVTGMELTDDPDYLDEVERESGLKIFVKKKGTAKKEYRFETKKPVSKLIFQPAGTYYGPILKQVGDTEDEVELDLVELADRMKHPLNGSVTFREIGNGLSKTVSFNAFDQIEHIYSFLYEVGNPGKLRELEKHGLKVE